MADTAGLELKLALSSGIPEAFTATVNAYVRTRETMDPDIRRRWDLLHVGLSEWFWYDVLKIPRSEAK